MKNILFSILLLMSGLSIAQTNTFPASGNVGIGTTSPTSKLQVSGGSNNWGQTIPGLSTGSIHLDPENSSDHFGSAITFGASDTSNGENAQAGIYVRSDGSYGTKMYFATTDAYVLGSKTAMIIDQKGNVGIGTDGPTAKVDIRNGHLYVGDETFANPANWGQTINIDDDLHSRILIEERTTGVQTSLWSHTGGNARVGTVSDHDFGIMTKGKEKIMIKTNGDVGIGTSTPDRKLDIVGGNSWQMKLSNTTETKRMFMGWYESRNAMEISTWGDGVYENVPLSFLPKKVSFNGKVGIGTTNPDSKLTVKGKIHAEEVKIDLSVPAPDYVFTKDYYLLTIEEVQQHIKENGHLPNVPSATEMETNGVELGLMNMKLLEKIEELTLYTINQEKKLQEQEKRLQKLEALLIDDK
ncbi:tail fiber protein [Aquimarina algiphila]|uniref:tail fiber protein n=1 Tax=Aquimarina algiphila TaxID=2047982 RepID=UPI00249210A5|nr:tail fiber protein [Aquimarina algiphila]